MNANQLAELLSGSCCWAIENENYSGGPDSNLYFDCPQSVTEEDIDHARLAVAGKDYEAIEDVSADAVLKAFFRTQDTSEITHRWLDSCGAYSDGFRDVLVSAGFVAEDEGDA